LSDGEALSGELDGVLAKASAADVSIFCAGTGTEDGDRIPSSSGGFVKDAAGEIVVTRLDENALKTIADSTGGKYYHVLDNGLLPELLKLASGSEIIEADEGYRIVTKERYRFFLVFALAGLLIAKFVKVIKWKNFY